VAASRISLAPRTATHPRPTPSVPRSQLVLAGSLVKLNEKNWPGCYLARSPPADVARVESRTYICSESAWPPCVQRRRWRWW
jgi:hypothetical protein